MFSYPINRYINHRLIDYSNNRELQPYLVPLIWVLGLNPPRFQPILIFPQAL